MCCYCITITGNRTQNGYITWIICTGTRMEYKLVSKEIAKTITPEYANLPDVESTLTDGELAKHDNPPDAIFDELLITKQASLHNFKRRLS